MSLVSYIVTSILLSWLGIAAYWVLRRFDAPFAARRLILWMVVALSLFLPWLPEFSQVAPTARHPASSPATNLNDFCHCTNPGARDLIRYQASRANDLLITYRPWIWGVFASILVLVLLRFGTALIRLLWLTRTYAAEHIQVGGVWVRLVRGVPGMQAGALRLGGRYIFWHPALDSLPEAEQAAIRHHELSHIRQANTLERLILGLVQSVWFLNPAYYFISKELVQLSEYSADRYAVAQMQDPKAYARLLLKIKTQPDLALVPLFKGGMLKARVQAVLQPPAHSPGRFGLALICGLAFILPGELLAENLIHQQIREIEVYEFLCEVNDQTGKEEFCKKCTYEAVDACK